ncbi:peptide synthetase [Colletotrichum incanum]|uniref:Peptide synthetase n=1 Tax=Colletotrichum incanum TaxID=1573173 RepID=A0A167CNB3_COLIC|nr:peptide synthetase [Colletotrichum incanum]
MYRTSSNKSAALPVPTPVTAASGSWVSKTQRSIWTWQELFPRTNTPRLLCVVSLRHGRIDVGLSTSTAAIPITRSQRLFQQFSHIAGQLVGASPGAVVRDLDLASPRDVADMRRWNAAAPVEPELACLHWPIEQHAADRPDADTGVAVRPSNPAFAVFTSGSTCKPKGIAIEHGAICTSIRDHGRVMRFSDIFTTLSFGSCVCVPSDEDRLDDLAGCIVKLEANHACLTVTVAAQLQLLDVPGLRTLVVGGESVTARVVQQWADPV